MKSTRRGSFSVHRSEKTPGSKYSSTSGLSPRGHLERQAALEIICCCPYVLQASKHSLSTTKERPQFQGKWREFASRGVWVCYSPEGLIFRRKDLTSPFVHNSNHPPFKSSPELETHFLTSVLFPPTVQEALCRHAKSLESCPIL